MKGKICCYHFLIFLFFSLANSLSDEEALLLGFQHHRPPHKLQFSFAEFTTKVCTYKKILQRFWKECLKFKTSFETFFLSSLPLLNPIPGRRLLPLSFLMLMEEGEGSRLLTLPTPPPKSQREKCSQRQETPIFLGGAKSPPTPSPPLSSHP